MHENLRLKTLGGVEKCIFLWKVSFITLTSHLLVSLTKLVSPSWEKNKTSRGRLYAREWEENDRRVWSRQNYFPDPRAQVLLGLARPGSADSSPMGSLTRMINASSAGIWNRISFAAINRRLLLWVLADFTKALNLPLYYSLHFVRGRINFSPFFGLKDATHVTLIQKRVAFWRWHYFLKQFFFSPFFERG